MESDLIAELERRIADCPTVCHSDRQHLAALTAALTLAKACDRHIKPYAGFSTSVLCEIGDHPIIRLREALAIAEKQIGGSDGK